MCVGMCIACATDEEWEALVGVARSSMQLSPAQLNHAQLARPEFATASKRREQRTALDAALNEWTDEQDKWELTNVLQAAGVPAFPVLDAIEVIHDPHLSERRRHFDLGDRFPAGELLNGNPWHLSECRPKLRRPGPEFGAHTAEVVQEWLGVSLDEIRDGA